MKTKLVNTQTQDRDVALLAASAVGAGWTEAAHDAAGEDENRWANLAPANLADDDWTW